MSLWNSNTKSAEIKGHLDAGDIALFGMTYEPTHPTTAGYENWFNYALSRNPNTTFMIGLPWSDFPSQSTTSVYTSTYRGAVQTLWPGLIGQLRSLYPNVTIIDNPYGLSAIELRLLFDGGHRTAGRSGDFHLQRQQGPRGANSHRPCATALAQSHLQHRPQRIRWRAIRIHDQPEGDRPVDSGSLRCRERMRKRSVLDYHYHTVAAAIAAAAAAAAAITGARASGCQLHSACLWRALPVH